MVVNAQSMILVISGRNTINLITSRSLFTVPDISQFLSGGVFGAQEVECAKMAELSKLEALAIIGKACYVSLYIYILICFHKGTDRQFVF